MELYYILKSKLNFKLLQSVVEGGSIKLGGYTYIQLSSKPRGRSIKQRLVGQDSGDTLIIYN